MAQSETQSIPREQFLIMSVNLLHRALIDSTRTEAKNIYKEIAAGGIVPLTTVQMEDKSTVRFDLSMDHSEYDGKINYSAFRASLAALLSNLARALQEGQEVSTFGAENNPNTMIFGITGVTLEKEVPAVMVLSSTISDREAAVMLRLMYLDYQQFLSSQGDEQPTAQA